MIAISYRRRTRGPESGQRLHGNRRLGDTQRSSCAPDLEDSGGTTSKAWFCGVSGRDVLVHPEDVVGIILALDLHQSVKVGAIIGAVSCSIVVAFQIGDLAQQGDGVVAGGQAFGLPCGGDRVLFDLVALGGVKRRVRPR